MIRFVGITVVLERFVTCEESTIGEETAEKSREILKLTSVENRIHAFFLVNIHKDVLLYTYTRWDRNCF